jgi:DNA-binding NtrC family response regulator
MKGADIVVVEDEEGLRELLKAQLGRAGAKVRAFATAEEAWDQMAKRQPDLLLTDLRLPGLSGDELLKKVKEAHPEVPVLVVSAFGSARNVVDVIKQGAEDYLAKPIAPEDLEAAILRALEKRALFKENARLRKALQGGEAGFAGMVGRAKPMLELYDLIKRLAPSDGTVLIGGESGSGKELVARALHQSSNRAKGAFVDVNAGSLPATLFEAELFGAKKGSFTGATETRDGLFQAADGGTLFLDEVAEVPMESQAKLLRVLETHEVKMLGEARSRKVDVRVLAATHQDLARLVKEGKFREDLYFRLSVLPLRVPPLRERMEDLPMLAEVFLGRFAVKGQAAKRLAPEALQALLKHRWPGNVRELRNVLERASLLSRGAAIQAADVAVAAEAQGQGSLPQGAFMQAKRAMLEGFERDYLTRLLKDSDGNVSEAARQAGLDRKNLQVLLKKHRLQPSQFKGASAAN